jgi:cation diffusion facilitator CzcD-associated flavoprotein CzcO
VSERLDVLIVGAGLSGVGAACHLQKHCPGKTFALLERRQAIGGTWDLFRYPGIRSDSDIYTLGYKFKPWTGRQVIADGHLIRNYIQEAAREHHIDRKIRFGIQVQSARWSSADATWTVRAKGPSGEPLELRAGFLMMCSGYYNYDRGHDPVLAGRERFQGRIIHPQFWPEDIDYDGKRIVVIGSGATAVTLLPALTERAAHVTMLQRSPSYIMSAPRHDDMAVRLRKFLSAERVYHGARALRQVFSTAIFTLSRKQPRLMRRFILAQVRKQVGDAIDMTHFTPRYFPWEERLCAAPDGDLFTALRAGKASVVTDQIASFTASGISLASGQELPADIIITATGLEVQLFGGIELQVDGHAVDFSKTLFYKGTMLSGVPNFSNTFGYTNASWTLKADLIAEYICRVLKHMDATGTRQCTPIPAADVTATPLFDMQSGYIKRAEAMLPKQGNRPPWCMNQSYKLDTALLQRSPVDDGVLQFTNPKPAAAKAGASLSAVAEDVLG